MKALWMVLLVALTTGGCALREYTPFDTVRFVKQSDGNVFAEVDIVAPSDNSRLVGDTSQDVVALIHKEGRMALPQTVPFDGQIQGKPSISPSNGVCQISVYHLMSNRTDNEIGYYKRRFARGK